MSRQGQFKKGQGGRPPGVPNKFTKTVKEAVTWVFINIQDHPKANLRSWAIRNPSQFYQIAARLIPTEIQANLTGKLEIKKPSWYDEQRSEQTAIHILPSEAVKEAAGN